MSSHRHPIPSPTGRSRSSDAPAGAVDSVEEISLDVSRARLALWQTAGRGVPLLFLHGNASCKEVFARQFAGPIGRRYRCIAPDLPGHGASSDASDVSAYTFAGHAQTAIEILEALDIDEVILIGWSMGGHVALEVMARFPGVVGTFLMAAPPVEPGLRGLMHGFRLPALGLLTLGRSLGAAHAERLVELGIGPGLSQHHIAAARRTDGRARRELVGHIVRGRNADGLDLVETHHAPIAVVNGRDDPLVDLNSFARPRWANLWRDTCFEVPGGHAPFFADNPTFDGLLLDFLFDMDARAQAMRDNPPLALGG